MNRSSLYIFVSIFLAIGLGYLITGYNRRQQDKVLLKYSIMTSGKFTGEMKKYKKGSNGPWFVCQYTFKGETYEANVPENLVNKLRPRLFTKYFPVILDSTNPSNSHVLIFSHDFERFDLIQPDSLTWVNN